MTETNDNILENGMEENAQGSIKISGDVVATIAGMAAGEVNGIAGMSGGLAGGFAEMLGRKNLTKGIKVDIEEPNVVIDIFVTVEYGVFISQVAQEVQAKVKTAVETMTGLTCTAVNVHVQGVAFPAKEANPE